MSHPTVLWSQTPTTVTLTVDVIAPTNVSVVFEETVVHFKCTAGTREIQFDLTLSHPIDASASKFVIRRGVDISLVKQEPGSSWTALTPTKLAWVKVDWSKWVSDEDDEKPQMGGNPYGDFDFGSMGGMGGMGGMGMGGMGGMGMGGMGGMDMSGMDMGDNADYGSDSDDEEPMKDTATAAKGDEETDIPLPSSEAATAQ